MIINRNCKNTIEVCAEKEINTKRHYIRDDFWYLFFVTFFLRKLILFWVFI